MLRDKGKKKIEEIKTDIQIDTIYALLVVSYWLESLIKEVRNINNL